MTIENLLSIIVFLIGVLMTILSWIGRAKVKELADHNKACFDKHADHETLLATLDTRIDGLEYNQRETHQTVTWIGDCVVQIGASLDAKLPQRPVNGRK